ncbi:hypothetical protein A7X95_05930 [Candidatus Nitrosopelagicus brevis]|uniref:Uncharacterized protein n=1 Tax=Candidatus Nitrosopelagicus brevis TaxID=1410606 RepID=A0A2R6T9V4_9ARCH|nr:hypothetical protein [Candidatus Nitrosopelagicus brevis]MAR69754.1 hypothetical protein [Nitrospina sp.]PTL87428.1 hypothetical protein A7X95_05930 [Candidatus Nitrosopelagicus brevis]|tara:strand:+ start:8689 stop:9039 length:351 start_codon:yes stop_codon:yes gene_type:complete
MQTSSPRFKSLAVTAGLSFWFFIITSGTGSFSILYFALFVGIVLTITQVFAKKISKGLDIFAIINTKVFLGSLYIFVISIYGILFKLLRIDLLRLKKQNQSYWLEIESSNDVRKMF